MKKLFFLASVAALALTSCSNDEDIQGVADVQSNGAINFSAYTTSNVNSRGTVVRTDSIIGATRGIGVFAFYQPCEENKTDAPFYTSNGNFDYFMSNQRVHTTGATDTGAKGTWTYDPVKYWPNNPHDELSFFAYAPYKAGTTLADLDFNVDSNGKFTKVFTVAPDYMDQVDYLFAAPTMNMTKPTSISTDALGTGVVDAEASPTHKDDIVYFDFQHVMSKVNILVGVLVDNKPTNTADSPEAWSDANTTIQIQNITFENLTKERIYTQTAANVGDWQTSTNKQNIVVEPYVKKGETAYFQNVADYNAANKTSLTKEQFDLLTAAEKEIKKTYIYPDATTYNKYNGTSLSDSDFAALDASKKTIAASTSTINYGEIKGTETSPWAAGWHHYLMAPTSEHSASEADHEAVDYGYLFLTPEDVENQNIVITYTVTTKDEKHPENNSVITNKITKSWKDFRNDALNALEAGMQYNLFFQIGMQSVKIAATVTDWKDGDDHYIDVPTPQGY